MVNRSPNIGLASGLRKSTSMPIPNAANAAYYSDVARNDAENRNNLGSASQLWWPYPKNLNDTPNTIPEAQYAATKWDEATSAIGNEQAQGGFSNLMSTRGEGDPRSNERYQQLLARRDDIVAEIYELTSEIAWQETLKKRNLTQDPLWEEAKYNWIYKGDSSDLDKIMARREAEIQRQFQAEENRKNREQTTQIAKMNREKELSDKKDAEKDNFDTKIRLLRFALNDNKGMFNTPSARSTIFSAWNDTLRSAEKLGIDEDKLIESIQNEYPEYGDFRAFIRQKREPAGEGAGSGEDMSQLEIRFNNAKSSKDMEAILKSAEGMIDPTKKTEWKEKIKKAKNSEPRNAEENAVKNTVDEYNSNSHSTPDAKAKKEELTRAYPNYTFTIGQGNKIVAKRKAGK